jgi:hypothetical protein
MLTFEQARDLADILDRIVALDINPETLREYAAALEKTAPVEVEEAGEDQEGRIVSPVSMLEYMLAGKAVFTIRSKRSQRHYTYKVTRAKDNGEQKSPLRWWVNVLTGDNNSNPHHYSKMGQVVCNSGGYPHFRMVQGAQFSKDSFPTAGFKHVLTAVVQEDEVALAGFEFFHEGRCGVCNRRLTDPESVARGIGPVCLENLRQ